MIAIPAGVRIVVAARPVDFRNGLDGLAARVQQALRENPFAGDLFVFRAKRADRVKILAWDGTGLCLFHKRLEKGRFVWPPVQNGVIRLSAAQLGLLVEGLDWSRVRPRPVIAPVLAG
ncbi:MAG: IS66 family insertion sequence element accessory protein TnpB [Acetobacteraceae bacterium]|nr:IS66 family insertion sequence element accessory protein TnpB [Acetobacteraceae bacterium]